MYLSTFMDPKPPISLPQIAGSVLNDLRHYLAVIDPVIYQAPLEILSGSTIGQHTRHIIEFYNCLVEQYSHDGISEINYAKRRRDFLIESAPDHALQNVNQICELLSELDPKKKCLLDCTEHGQENLLVPSTIGRNHVHSNLYPTRQ